jgi:hypothetical protein
MAPNVKKEESENVLMIGTIPITKTTEISLYLDTYRGKRYANIRKFARSAKYTGATKQGIKLSEKNLSDILAVRSGILDRCNSPEEAELCRSRKFPGTDIVLKVTLYEGKYGLDIRAIYKQEDGSEGFGRGIRLPVEKADNILELLAAMAAQFHAADSAEQPRVQEPKNEYPSKKNSDLPPTVKKYF